MQRVNNYGSFMQALSLKTILEELGHEVVFVDFKAKPSIQHRRSFHYWIDRAKSLIRETRLYWIIANIVRRRQIGYRIPKPVLSENQAFIQALEELGVDNEHPHYHTKVDALIIGSDEVFNCLQNTDNVGYSLELFGKNNRARILLSYAASFGNTTLERLEQYGVQRQIGRYLDKFDAISVRDENSAQIVRKLTGKEPFQHLDPALIGGIEKMNWKENDEKNYIALYAYSNRISKEEGEQISSFANGRGLRVLIINGVQKNCSFETIKNRDPKEIIPYVRNANMLITDTFHGTIFSIINHIPFAVYCRKPQDVSYSNSEKLLDLLKKFDLTDRLISESNDLDTVFSRRIDFEKLDMIRAKERAETIQYFKNALSQ